MGNLTLFGTSLNSVLFFCIGRGNFTRFKGHFDDVKNLIHSMVL